MLDKAHTFNHNQSRLKKEKLKNITKNMKNIKSYPTNVRIAALLLLIVLALPSLLPFLLPRANAGTLTNSFVRFDRMTTSTATTGTVCAKPATAGTEVDVRVTFPTGYTLGTSGNFTVTTTTLAWPTGGTAWLGIGTATNVTGQVVTFPSNDLVVGTLYCFNWSNTAAVSIKGTATADNSGSIETRATGPSQIDTANYATASVSNDQVTVSASINQTFSFALSGSTDALGTLTTGAVAASPTPRTVTLNTNAKNGWQVWGKDTNTGLNSASAAYTIASTGVGAASQALVAGTEGYNLGVTATRTGGTGAMTVDANFDGAASKGGGLDTALRNLVSCTGTANNAVVTLTNRAAINGATSAATDYTDIQTYVGAGIF
ncbi:hypothetical protein H0X09_03195 [Candidatus Saccharibacteria bacterium]|nr:hypothetical protein [Candidatus Saccharibacteria bacterium]